jgi:hypothetical protein
MIGVVDVGCIDEYCESVWGIENLRVEKHVFHVYLCH